MKRKKKENKIKILTEKWKKRYIITPKNLFAIVSYFMIVLLTWLFVNAGRYSFYWADDFSNANAVGVFGENVFALFKASVHYMIKIYRTWQGTYFSVFLMGFLSPLNGFGEKQLAIVMVFNIIFFVLSLYFFIKEMCRLLKMDNCYSAFLVFLLLFSIFGFKAWTEIFYWFTGVVSYSIPLSVTMLGITLYMKNKNMGTYVAACIFSFLASGGSLMVAGLNCFGILTILFVKGYKQCKKKDYIFLGGGMLGAIINTAAPGNYVRHDVIESNGLHIGSALLKSINYEFSSLEYLLYSTPFLLILFLCVVLGFYTSREKHIHKNQIYKTMLMFGLMPIVTCFPTFLAYGVGNEGFPNRCEFMSVFTVILAMIIISFLSGILLREVGLIEEKSRELFMVILLFLCFIMPTFNESFRYSNTVICRMCENTATGKFKAYYNEVKNIYTIIEKSESPDVVIESLPQAIADFPDMSATLSIDSTDWRNQSVAAYYGKNSVTLKQPEQ